MRARLIATAERLAARSLVMLTASVWQRLLVAAALVLLLWLAVAWALSA